MDEQLGEIGGKGPEMSVQQSAHEEELRKIAVLLEQGDYRSSMTIIGEDLIREIRRSVEFGDFELLEKAVLEALPLMEGLEFGIFPESYGGIPVQVEGRTPEQQQRAENNFYSRLRNMLYTVEDSTDRGNVGYLRDATLDALSRPIRELEEWDKDGGETWEKNTKLSLLESYRSKNLQKILEGEPVLSDEEIQKRVDETVERLKEKHTKRIQKIRENKERLLQLDLHVKSRLIFDQAFRMRQFVAHDRELQADMKKAVGLGEPEPDGPHFQGLFQVYQEWGDAVDRTLRELVKMGYEGFYRQNPDTKKFKEWFNRGLEASKIDGQKRMDVFWMAWRLFCFMELAGKFSMGVGEDGRITFDANPPFVGDLATWLSRPEEHRAAEYGWNIQTLEQATNNPDWDGEYVGERPAGYRAISHSGHPRGIGHLTETPQGTERDPLPTAIFGKWAVGNYLEFATLQQGPNKGKNLWQIWWEEGVSMANDNFPWIDTDWAGAKGISDEAPSGSVGYWFLQRGRALAVLKDVLGIPELRNLDSLSHATKFRNWQKLGMVKPDEFNKNPAFVYLLTAILPYLGLPSDGRLTELDLASSNPNEQLTLAPGGQGYPGISVKNIISHFYEVGLIGPQEFGHLRSLGRNKRQYGAIFGRPTKQK